MTRRLFRTALIELMQEKPFEKITIKELCEQADLNRTTFYLHYNDQKELLDEVIGELKEKSMAYLSSFKRDNDGSHIIKNYLDFIKDNAALYKTLMHGDRNGGAKSQITAYLEQELFARWPIYGNDAENRYVFAFMVDGGVSIIVRWIENGFDMPSSDLASLIYHLLHGLNKRM